MKNKLLIGIITVICLFVLVGCGNSNKEESSTETKTDKNTHVCKKTGIEDSIKDPEMKWTKDITHTAKVNDDSKLTYYSSLTKYYYESKDDCNYWCDIKVDWNDEFNSKNYTGGHRNTECKCDNKELTEEWIYDDIENLDSILRSDISELNKDNIFDLDAWESRYKKANYKCS